MKNEAELVLARCKPFRDRSQFSCSRPFVRRLSRLPENHPLLTLWVGMLRIFRSVHGVT
jgi:hypothetical protein